MKYKPHFNPTFGRWKTAPYGRNPNEKTQKEKMSEMWETLCGGIASLCGLRRKTNKTKKAKSRKE
ncbi:MAG: hypothetical protein EBT95_06615 [Verrucomicrobia bacterium]|nr:hypothetical protein [Verrucomicrobiota bacterium]